MPNRPLQMSLIGELVNTATRELSTWAAGGSDAPTAGRDALLAIDAAVRLLGSTRSALIDDLQRAGICTDCTEAERSAAVFDRIQQVRRERGWPELKPGPLESGPGDPAPGKDPQ